MEYVALKDVCNINMGQSPDSKSYNEDANGIPFFQGNADFGERYPVTRIWCDSPTKIAEKDDILISVRAPIGALNYAKETCCIGRGLAALTPNKTKVSTEFIFWLLKGKNAELNKQGTGSTFKAINKKVLEETKVPNIPLEKQLEYSTILEKLYYIIQTRQKQLEKLDEFIKSRFVEMFGEPELNQKGFPIFRMDEVVEFQGGSQPDKKYFEYEKTDDNIRLIQIRDYKTDKYITYIPKSMAKRFCSADDIMIGRYGPPIFQILQGIEGCFNVALMKATPKTGNKEFIRYFLKQDCLLHYLEGMSQRTAGQDGIQMDKLKAYPFPMPPIELQNQFADFVKQVDKSKFAVQKELDKTQMLFDSLMQEYFG